MDRLTSAKLEQASRLVGRAGVDLWMTFVRETAEGSDPVLPLILEGGLTWPSALIVDREGRRIAIVGTFDADPLRASGDWHEVIAYDQSIREPLLDVLRRSLDHLDHAPRIGVNFSTSDSKADGLTHGMYRLLTSYLRDTPFEGTLVSAEEITSALRSQKTEEEIGRIRAAIDETERLFEEVGRMAAVGVSEREIFDTVQERIDERHLGYAWDRAGNPIVNTGPDSMIGHGIPSADIRIRPGHILHLDLGVIRNGYSSDMQRCWYVAAEGETEIPKDVTRALTAVVGAIEAGFERLRPGVPGWRVDAAAREAIQGAGYPEYRHATGHQVGRLGHDGGAILGPRWERYGNTPELPLTSNQVFTLELGVWVEGRGYLGLEEMVRITEAGAEWLTDRQLALRRLG